MLDHASTKVGLPALLAVAGLSCVGCSPDSPASNRGTDAGQICARDHEQAYDRSDSIYVDLKTDHHGKFRAHFILEVAEAKKTDGPWHPSSEWKLLFIRPSGDKPLPNLRVMAPAPLSRSKLKAKTYRLETIPRDRDSRVIFTDQNNNAYRLWGEADDREPDQPAGSLTIEVDGKHVSGEIDASLGRRPDANPETLERMRINGEFEGIWELDCFRDANRPDGQGWTYDREKESDFCNQFARDPWPHLPP